MEVAGCERLGLGGVDAAEALDLVVAAVVLPFPLAAESYQRKKAHLVAEVIDGVVLSPDVLETDAVEAHVAYIFKLCACA